MGAPFGDMSGIILGNTNFCGQGETPAVRRGYSALVICGRNCGLVLAVCQVGVLLAEVRTIRYRFILGRRPGDNDVIAFYRVRAACITLECDAVI